MMKLVLTTLPEGGIGNTLAALAPFLARNGTSLWFSVSGELAEIVPPVPRHTGQSTENSRSSFRRMSPVPAGLTSSLPSAAPIKGLLIVLAFDAEVPEMVAAITGASAAGADSTGTIIVSPVIRAIALTGCERDSYFCSTRQAAGNLKKSR